MQQITLENLIEPDFLTNESYKSLRTNIQFCGSDVRMICFTSCLPNEGKSNVSFNLAMSFAESGKNVIFVDADLRRSILTSRYEPDQLVNGLAHFLSGQNTLEEIIYETNVENLSMVFAGWVPPNPAELVGSELFRNFIKMLREKYDYVIIDTPPLVSVIDSAVVAEQCDGVILVIEANIISHKLAQRVKHQLERGKCRILGAVLNKAHYDQVQSRYYKKAYRSYEDSNYGIY